MAKTIVVLICLVAAVFVVVKMNSSSELTEKPVATKKDLPTIPQADSEDIARGTLTSLVYVQANYYVKNSVFAQSYSALSVTDILNKLPEKERTRITNSFVGENGKENPYEGYLFKFLHSEQNTQYGILAYPMEGLEKYPNFYVNESLVIFKNEKPVDVSKLKSTKDIDWDIWKQHVDLDKAQDIDDLKNLIMKLVHFQKLFDVEFSRYAESAIEIVKKLKTGNKEEMMNIFIKQELVFAFPNEPQFNKAVDGYKFIFLETDNNTQFCLLIYPDVVSEHDKSYFVNQSGKIYETISSESHRSWKSADKIDPSKWKAFTGH